MRKSCAGAGTLQSLFSDSMTIGTAAMRAASGTGVKGSSAKRSSTIRKTRRIFAVSLITALSNWPVATVPLSRLDIPASRNGSRAAMVYRLPAISPGNAPCSLLNEPQVDTSRPVTPQKIDAPRNPFRGVKMCKPKNRCNRSTLRAFSASSAQEHYAKFRGCSVSAQRGKAGENRRA